MFCQKCGTLINPNLNYCNNCGTKVAKSDDQKSSPLNSLITTVGYVAFFGLAFLVGLIAILLDKIQKTEFVAVIAFAYLGTLFGICFLLIKQISKLTDNQKTSVENAATFYQPIQLSAPSTAQLEEPKQQPISVTENTTKTLDEVLLKRN